MTDGKEYGKALFMLTEECGTTEKVAEDVKVARSAFIENPDFIKLLDTPALSADERVTIADKAFSSLDENLLNLIKILTENHITSAFIKAADEVVPGFASYETLLYSPELKFYSNRVKMDESLTTSVKGLFCLGDSSGWTRGLMMASVMGVLMGRRLAELG